MSILFSDANIMVSKILTNSGDSILSFNNGLVQQLVELCKWSENLGKYFNARARLRSKMWNSGLANTVDLMLVIGFYPVGHERKVLRDSESIQQHLGQLTEDHILIHPCQSKVLIPCSVSTESIGDASVRYFHKHSQPLLQNGNLCIIDGHGDVHKCTELYSIQLSKFLSVLRHGLAPENPMPSSISRTMERVMLAMCHFVRYMCTVRNEGMEEPESTAECFQKSKEMRFLPMVDELSQFRNREHLQNRFDQLTEDNLLLNFPLGRIFSLSSTKTRRSLRLAKKSNLRFIMKSQQVTFLNGKYTIKDNFGESYPLYHFLSLRLSLMKHLMKKTGAERLVQLFNLGISDE